MDMQDLEVGNWKVGEQIGEGGMGKVYIAHHKFLSTRAALKVLSPLLTSDISFRERFYQEAQTQAQLQHDNIARVLDYVEKDGRFHLIVEYLAGGTLADLIDQTRSPLAIEAALVWAKQALSALDYAHQRGVIHRDIKTSNIMLDENRQAKVMDFGIALVMGGRRLTSTGMTMGTPEYMSPEQIIRPKDVDHRTDVYSMGIVLYEMLTGVVPFNGETDYSIKAAQVNEPPKPLRQVNPNIPEAVETVVMKALTKDPYYRLPGCGQFIRLLEEAMQPSATINFSGSPTGVAPAYERTPNSSPQQVMPPPPPPLYQNTVAEPSAQRKTMVWKIVAAVMLLVAIGATFAVYYISRVKAEEERRQHETLLAMEKKRAEEERIKAEEEKRRAMIAEKHANPIIVNESGVTIEEPKLDADIDSYSKLGSPRYKFWLYAVVDNNLYEIDNQSVSWMTEVTWSDGKTYKGTLRDQAINSSKRQDLISDAWSTQDGSAIPYGSYSYRIIINNKIVQSGSFTIP